MDFHQKRMELLIIVIIMDNYYFPSSKLNLILGFEKTIHWNSFFTSNLKI